MGAEQRSGTEWMRWEVVARLLGLAGGVLMLRDWVLGATRRMRRHALREEFYFASEGRRLAAVWVPGAVGEPVLLLCHGIGETVEHWSAVQALLADHGIGSMVFNYSGYGRSSGRVRPEYCDEDFVAAYAELRRRVGVEAKVFVLGVSLGTGIAARGVGRLEPPVAGVFLCQAFDCFREAVGAAGAPRWVARMADGLWDTVAAVGSLRMPVWVVHSDGDRLFPMEMPRRIVRACGEHGELIVVEGFTHSEPLMKAPESYWLPIVERVRG